LNSSFANLRKVSQQFLCIPQLQASFFERMDVFFLHASLPLLNMCLLRHRTTQELRCTRKIILLNISTCLRRFFARAFRPWLAFLLEKSFQGVGVHIPITSQLKALKLVLSKQLGKIHLTQV